MAVRWFSFEQCSRAAGGREGVARSQESSDLRCSVLLAEEGMSKSSSMQCKWFYWHGKNFWESSIKKVTFVPQNDLVRLCGAPCWTHACHGDASLNLVGFFFVSVTTPPQKWQWHHSAVSQQTLLSTGLGVPLPAPGNDKLW